MACLVLLNEDGSTVVHELRKERTIIGSKLDSDLVVPASGVSRHHASITRTEDGYLLEDLGSTNFTFVDENEIQSYPLCDETVFSLGKKVYILFLERRDEKKIERFVQRYRKKERTRAATFDNTTSIFTKVLPKTVKELEALIEVGATITSVLDLQEVLNLIIDKMLSLMKADRGFIMLLEKGRLVPKAARNMEKELADEERLSFSHSFARKVIEKGEVLISTNVAEDPRYKSESIISQRIISIMGAPLKVHQETIGCIYIDAKEQRRYFSDTDASFFSALANQAAIAIQNASLAEKLKKHQRFLEQTNLQLQRSLEKLIEANIKIDRKMKEISALYDLSRSLNMTDDQDSVLKLVLERSREVLGTERAVLLMYSDREDGFVPLLSSGGGGCSIEGALPADRGITGRVALGKKGLIVNNPEEYPDEECPELKGGEIRQLMCVPLLVGNECTGILGVMNSRTDKGFSEEDLNLLTSMANLAAASIEKFRLYKQRLYQEKLNQEMEDAMKVQQLLLPRELPYLPQFTFTAKYAVANKVGGDYYDFIQLPQERLAVVIADVSGHDIASAIVMAMGRDMVRMGFERTLSPARILAMTSERLKGDTQASRYITMFIGVINPEDSTLTYSNAGHNYPLLLRKGSDEFIHLKTGGFPLGLVEDYSYEEETLRLDEGDLLVLYTDGLIEAQSADGEMFQLSRLEKLVLHTRDKKLHEMAEEIYETALRFHGAETLEDDFTFVAIKKVNPPAPMRFKVPSDMALIGPAVERVCSYARTNDIPVDEFHLNLVVKEAVTNAMEHGNSFDRRKSVHITAEVREGRLVVRVRDEGSGYDPAAVLKRARRNNREKSFSERGRGLIIIHEYCDEVGYNEDGTEITLVLSPGGNRRGN